MKICPRCNSEVEDNFDMCWSCQYSFPENKVFTERDFGLQCPGCNSVISPDLNFCPVCKQDLNAIADLDLKLNPGQVAEIECLRCKIPMSFNGNIKLHEGTRFGAFGNLFELFTNRESFDLYFCPKCRKVEFFIPDISN